MTNPYNASLDVFKIVAQKMGFFDPRFLTNWKDIVGEEIANKCSPSKMVFDRLSREATLFVFSQDFAFKSMLTHYREPILSKIKLYFGINFITDVKISKL